MTKSSCDIGRLLAEESLHKCDRLEYSSDSGKEILLIAEGHLKLDEINDPRHEGSFTVTIPAARSIYIIPIRGNSSFCG
jgi:hypothetical protein